MSIDLDLLRRLQAGDAAAAWSEILGFAWEVFTQPLDHETAAREVARRETRVAALDHFLTTAGWDLWPEFDTKVEHTADALVRWWAETPGGKAVLLLDALSLRESPWILHGAAERGYNVKGRATSAELPADTTQFAKALGFGQRSLLANDGAGHSHKLPGAKTDCVDFHWVGCLRHLGPDPLLVLWHAWPDSRVHDYAVPGRGVGPLTEEAATMLTDDSFWALIDRMTTGRRLIVTSDHGYAATGNFSDTSDPDQKEYLKEAYASRRWAKADGAGGEGQQWLPPLDLTLDTRQGRNRFVLGRRKWKSPGGYPTLAHGGLSILEVASPFIEIWR